MFAIPSITSYYFTAGKKYELYDVNKDKTFGHVLCDLGHPRAIGLEGKKSAHLWYTGKIDFKPNMFPREDYIRWAKAGRFTMEE